MRKVQEWFVDKFNKLTGSKKTTFIVGVVVGMIVMAIIVSL
jgi:hypothetical protein